MTQEELILTLQKQVGLNVSPAGWRAIMRYCEERWPEAYLVSCLEEAERELHSAEAYVGFQNQIDRFVDQLTDVIDNRLAEGKIPRRRK